MLHFQVLFCTLDRWIALKEDRRFEKTQSLERGKNLVDSFRKNNGKVRYMLSALVFRLCTGLSLAPHKTPESL